MQRAGYIAHAAAQPARRGGAELRESAPSQLLDAWRAAERRLSFRDPDASDFEEMLREVDRLRLEYQRVALGAVALGDQLHAAARETGRRLTRAVDRSATARDLLRATLDPRRENATG
jgi:hypothetical protein